MYDSAARSYWLHVQALVRALRPNLRPLHAYYAYAYYSKNSYRRFYTAYGRTASVRWGV